jgi:hypothetical protein
MSERGRFGEPWAIADIEKHKVWADDGDRIAVFREFGGGIEMVPDAAVAARAVACVNAMQGIEDPAAFVAAADALAISAAEAVAERDAARAEVKNLEGTIDRAFVKIETVGGYNSNFRELLQVKEKLDKVEKAS